MHLFVDEQFTAHSGRVLPFKIDCDALTDDDIRCLVHIAHEQMSLPWNEIAKVVGIPRGGFRFAAFLQRHTSRLRRARRILIVDDVLTSGSSMEEWRAKQERPADCIGLVIFARREPEAWIHEILRLNQAIR